MVDKNTLLKVFTANLNEIKEKVNKCDNNTPYLAADLMDTTYDNIMRKSLSPDEGYNIRHELYEILKNFRKCSCK